LAGINIHILFAIVFVLLSSLLAAQNLAPNPDFEIRDSSKKYNKVRDWAKVNKTKNYPAYYTIESPSTYTLFGKTHAYSGTGCWGLFLQPGYQMIEAKLLEPLKKDSVYEVSLYVSLGEQFCFFAIYGFPVFFSDSNLTRQSYKQLTPIFLLDEYNLPLYKKDTWQKTIGYYKAKGGEQYIHLGAYSENEIIKIGNLFRLPLTKTQRKHYKVRPSQYDNAYYYIDDISVRMINSKNIQTTEYKKNTTYRDSIGKVMEAGKILWNGYNIQWEDFLGRPPKLKKGKVFGAEVLTMISYTKHVDKSTRTPYIEVKTLFCRMRSSYNKYAQTNYVLKHEQLHFDITELFARKFRKDISNQTFKSVNHANKYIKKKFNYYFKELKKTHKLYDKEVGAIDLAIQSLWNKKIEDLLLEYEDYANYRVDVKIQR